MKQISFQERLTQIAATHDVAECWEWPGALTRGYGETWMRIDGRMTKGKTHRFAYLLLVGPIPDGMQLDHLCRNRACMNPRHLEPVTSRENTRRGDRAGTALGWQRQATCPRGHPKTPENTYIHTKRGTTACRPCATIRAKAAKIRQRQRKAAQQ